MSELVKPSKVSLPSQNAFVISTGFLLISPFLKAEQREGLARIQNWSRFCRADVRCARSPEEAKERLARLRELTRLAMLPDFPVKSISENPAFLGFHQASDRWNLPSRFAFEYLDGLQMEAAALPFRDDEMLLTYLYRAAGTLGQMTSYVLGANDERALDHAIPLAQSLLLMKIIRDVQTDALQGRVYLPISRLREMGWKENIRPTAFVLDASQREAVFRCIRSLALFAFELRGRGETGFKYLPFQSACAVAMAVELQNGRVRKLLHRGVEDWNEAPQLSVGQKISSALRGLAKVALYSPARLF